EPPAADQIATSLAAFRYDPEEDTLQTVEPPLILTIPQNSSPLPQAWIWQAKMNSVFCRSDAQHTLTCAMENAGLDKIQFQPPPGATLQSAYVDGARVDVGQTGDATHSGNPPWKFSLPPGQRFTTVALTWSDPQQTQPVVSSCAAAWPTVDVPIL